MRRVVCLLAVCVLFGSSGVMAHQLSWDNLLLASVKMQPKFDYEANVDTYMQLYRSDIWNRYRNDEFELQDKREETVAMMKDRVSSFSLEEEFVVYTAFTFGDYDFQKNVFPLDGVGETTYFHESNWKHGSFPRKYKVFFNNTYLIGDLNMSKDNARAFLKHRKDKYGNVDRRVNAKIQFRITNLRNDRDELEAELTHVTIYGDDHRAKVLQEY